MKSALLLTRAPGRGNPILLALQARGLSVTAMDDVSALSEACRTKSFRLVVCRLEAPRALQLCRELRAALSDEKGGAHLLVLVEAAAELDLAALIEAGADDCLPRPALPLDLDTRLAVAARCLARAEDILREDRKEMQKRLELADRLAAVGTL